MPFILFVMHKLSLWLSFNRWNKYMKNTSYHTNLLYFSHDGRHTPVFVIKSIYTK